MAYPGVSTIEQAAQGFGHGGHLARRFSLIYVAHGGLHAPIRPLGFAALPDRDTVDSDSKGSLSGHGRSAP